jgi:hypothetical protein
MWDLPVLNSVARRNVSESSLNGKIALYRKTFGHFPRSSAREVTTARARGSFS